MTYGELPKVIGEYKIEVNEMMFYQYLPIKMIGEIEPKFEDRLNCFNTIIGAICCDFIGVFGLNRYKESFVYLTAKNLWVNPGCSYNRIGYHSDGFLTEDINYVWCNHNPTIFNNSNFTLSNDDRVSMIEMEQQAKQEAERAYPENYILRLNQFNIHKVGNYDYSGMRAFVKISFSKDKYDLIGNSHNSLLDYSWVMRPRTNERNIPQVTVVGTHKTPELL